MADTSTDKGTPTTGDPTHITSATRSRAAKWGLALALYAVFDGFSHGMFDVRVSPFLSLTLAATAAAFSLAVADGRARRWWVQSGATPLVLVLVMFVSCVSLSGLVGRGGLNLGFIKNILLFLALVAFTDNERALKSVLLVAAAAGVIQAGLGLGQIVASGGIPLGGATGRLPNHVQYAVYLLLSGVCLVPFVSGASFRGKAAILLAEGLMMSMMVASLARGVLVVAGVSVVILALLAFDSFRARVITIAGVGLAAIATIGLSSRVSTMLEIPSALNNPAKLDVLLSGRLPLLLAAINIWKAHPVLGIGYGRFPEVWSQYVPEGVGIPGVLRLELATHSTYLQIAAELGSVGLAIYVALVALGLRAAWRGRVLATRGGLPSLRLAYAAVFVALLAAALHGVLDNTGWHDRVFYVLLAVAAGSERVVRAADGAQESA